MHACAFFSDKIVIFICDIIITRILTILDYQYISLILTFSLHILLKRFFSLDKQPHAAR